MCAALAADQAKSPSPESSNRHPIDTGGLHRKWMSDIPPARQQSRKRSRRVKVRHSRVVAASPKTQTGNNRSPCEVSSKQTRSYIMPSSVPPQDGRSVGSMNKRKLGSVLGALLHWRSEGHRGTRVQLAPGFAHQGRYRPIEADAYKSHPQERFHPLGSAQGRLPTRNDGAVVPPGVSPLNPHMRFDPRAARTTGRCRRSRSA